MNISINNNNSQTTGSQYNPSAGLQAQSSPIQPPPLSPHHHNQLYQQGPPRPPSAAIPNPQYQYQAYTAGMQQQVYNPHSYQNFNHQPALVQPQQQQHQAYHYNTPTNTVIVTQTPSQPAINHVVNSNPNANSASNTNVIPVSFVYFFYLWAQIK